MAIINRYIYRSQLCGDLQSVNIINSIILYFYVNLPAYFNAINNIFKFLMANIFTPYFLLILLYIILGNDVNIFIV